MEIDLNEFKDIPGWEGLYAVSKDGRVWSFHSKKILKSKLRRDGYLNVVLSRDLKTKTLMVHRLIALTYIANIENKSQVNHINGIKSDNRSENLEWTTPGENTRHAWENGLCKKVTGNKNHRFGKVGNNAIKVINVTTGEVFDSVQYAADKYNLVFQNVHKVLKGQRNHCGGFKFKYLEEVA